MKLNDFLRLFGFGEEPPPHKRTPKGYSIHAGLNSVDPNHYGGWSGNLRACENDAKHMAHMCSLRGFDERIILTREATSANFLSHLYAYAEMAEPGDTVVASFSGHGSQVPDYDGDESDGMDETICFFDRQVIDDELADAWSRFRPGVRVLFVSDSCHSGTMVRAVGSQAAVLAQEGSKALPYDVMCRTADEHVERYKGIQEMVKLRAPVRAHVLAWGACQDNQTAMDGLVNGAFTGALLRELREHPKDCYGRIQTRVVRALPPSQTPKWVFYGPRLDSFERGVPFSL